MKLACKKCNGTGYYGIYDQIGRIKYYSCEDCKTEGYIDKEEQAFKRWRLPRWV